MIFDIFAIKKSIEVMYGTLSKNEPVYKVLRISSFHHKHDIENIEIKKIKI